MVEIEFDFNQVKTIIQGNLQDKFQDIINKYIQETKLDPGSISFTINGTKIIPEQTVETQINEEENKIKVIVFLANQENKEGVFVKSKEIICPKCYKPCKIKIENYKIKLYDCVNNHITDDIKIKDFYNIQKINISKITCNNCKDKNKGNIYNNEFYKCLTCKSNLCPSCKLNHDQNHNIINYDSINFICQKHNEFFTKYCEECKINLCDECDQEHIGHNIIYFGDLVSDINQPKEQLSVMKTIIYIFNEKIKAIIAKLNEVTKSVDLFYEIQDN